MSYAEANREFARLLYGLDDLGNRNGFPVIDFDLSPRREDGVAHFEDEPAALAAFNAFARQLHMTPAQRGLSDRVTACRTVLDARINGKRSLDHLLLRTLGFASTKVSESTLEAAFDRAAESFGIACGGRFPYTSTGVADAYRAATPESRRTEAEVRANVLGVVCRAFGVSDTEEIRIGQQAMDPAFLGYAGTDEHGRIELFTNSNAADDRTADRGITEFHESAHAVQALNWQRNMRQEAHPSFMERTLMFGREQVVLEGMAETLPMWSNDIQVQLTPWESFRFASNYTGLLAWNDALRMAEDGDIEGALNHVDRWSPDATMPADRRHQIDIINSNPVLLCNRWSYIIGAHVHAELAMRMSDAEKSAFLLESAKAPMSPASLMSHAHNHGVVVNQQHALGIG